jgi:hypothetical protein
MSFISGIQKGTDKCMQDQKYENQNTSLKSLKTYTQIDKKHNYPRDIGHNNNESAKESRKCFMMQLVYLAYSLYNTNNRILVKCRCVQGILGTIIMNLLRKVENAL